MDLLAAITGSRVRADVLAALFGTPARSWNPSDLGRVVRLPHQVVDRQLRRLADAGFVHVRVIGKKRRYQAELDEPASRELARFVRQTRGRIPRIRRALVTLRSRTLAWAGPAAIGGASGAAGVRTGHLIVLTTAPRAMVRVQLAGALGEGIDLHVMSIREWLARLEKGDVLMRRVRRGRKLWILGSWDDLVARERAELESKRLLRAVRANWHEELSDEWDEDWDPFAQGGRS